MGTRCARRGGPDHCFAFALLILLANSVAVSEPPLLDEFRANVTEWTTGAGTVVFTREPTGEGARGTRRTFGFDATTGAWFSAYESSVALLTPEGVYYSGTPDEIAPSPDPAPGLAGAMSRLIPMALPLRLLQTTEGLVDITRDADGNWVIDYFGFAVRDRKPPLTRTMFSPQGKPLRFEMEANPEAGQEAEAYDYEFHPDSREPLLITNDRRHHSLAPSYQLVEIQYFATSRPDLFTPEAVLQIAVDNRMWSEMRRNAFAAQSSHSSRGTDPGTPIPYVQHRLSRAGWPLIISGIIVVAIGLIALFRARMGK